MAAPDAHPARVVRHDGVAVLVVGPRRVEHVPVRSSAGSVVAGDWVVVAGGAVAEVLPRASLLRRHDPDRGDDQPLAANLDVVAVVCGLDRPVRPGRIARTAALAWDAGAVPVVVLTKADLLDDAGAVAAEVAAATPGADVLAVSATDGAGLDALREQVRGRTVALVGESGAGKSTLTNALVGDTVAAVAEVRAGDAKGRHTTTSRQLHLLADGGVLVDSPGIRAVGLVADPDAVDATFADVDELAAVCRFADCAHDTEPGCAVTAAVATGELPADRLARWRALRREAESAALRADEAARRREGRRLARRVREVQDRPGRTGRGPRAPR
jgi:ribosome biogenesis GTPase